MNLASIFTASKQLQGEPSLAGTDATGKSSALDTALELWGKGADIYSTLTGKPATTVAPSGAVAAAAPAPKTNYLPWIIGGVVALVVLIFVFRK